jgi:hypothetical protein
MLRSRSAYLAQVRVYCPVRNRNYAYNPDELYWRGWETSSCGDEWEPHYSGVNAEVFCRCGQTHKLEVSWG